MPVQVYLSRRNLLTLLSKLDRFAKGEATRCTIIKNDTKHPRFPQSHPEITITAVEDDFYYIDREPGKISKHDREAVEKSA